VITLPVSEMFYSIQGEGRYAGHPSLFIRLAGCNMSCKGFACDTQRAVDVKQYKSSWKNYDDVAPLIRDIENLLETNAPCCLSHVVITGGEPVLHFENEIFQDLVRVLQKKEFKITVETNATVDIDFEKNSKYQDFVFAMGVKLSNSGERYINRIKPDIINSYIKNSKESFLKLVIDPIFIANGALEEINDISSILEQKTDIYCMPLGSTKEELQSNSYDVFEFCKDNGFIYSDRLHIRIYGHKEGV
jgi:7-carboxy-7-deazaguanine synthase